MPNLLFEFIIKYYYIYVIAYITTFKHIFLYVEENATNKTKNMYEPTYV